MKKTRLKFEYFLKSVKKSLILGVLLAVIVIFNFPQLVLSQGISAVISQNKPIGPQAEVVIASFYDGPTLPEITARQARSTMYITVTSYNSEPGQTDDTPFITAFGTHVRDGIVATNFLPKGTLVRFPSVFGEKTFVVEDRMNSRYYYRMDIFHVQSSD